MFNALGLGFSFVLSFLILPEADGTISEESNNDAFNDNVIIITIMIIIKGWDIIGERQKWHRLFELDSHSPRSQSGLWIYIFVSNFETSLIQPFNHYWYILFMFIQKYSQTISLDNCHQGRLLQLPDDSSVRSRRHPKLLLSFFF